MNTNDLINELSSKLTPVKKQDSPLKFALKYLALLFLIIVFGIVLLKLRSDLSKDFTDINLIA
jgi:hypothetical protein